MPYCVDCGHESSSQAATCPACGAHQPTAARGSTTSADAAAFVAALGSLLTRPIAVRVVVVAVAGVVLVLAGSLALALLVHLAAFGDVEELDGVGAAWNTTWRWTSTSLQLPRAIDGSVRWSSPLLALAVPVAALWLANALGRAVRPLAPGRASNRALAPAVAACFAAAIAVVGLFGPEGERYALGPTLLIAGAVAWWVTRTSLARAERRAAATSAAPATGTLAGAVASAGEPDPAPWRTWLQRSRAILVIAGAALATALAVTSIGTLAANVVDDVRGDDTRVQLVRDTLHVVDNGVVTLGHGMLASSDASLSPSGATGESLRAWQLREQAVQTPAEQAAVGPGVGGLGLAAWIVVLASAAIAALLGPLFAGFRLARAAAGATSLRMHALAGALAGPAWSALLLVAWLVVVDRVSGPDGTASLLSGVELVFFSLLIVTVLGAAGGLLAAAASSPAASAARRAAAPTVTAALAVLLLAG